MHPALNRIMAQAHNDELMRTVPGKNAHPIRRDTRAHRARTDTTTHLLRRLTARIG